MRAQSSCCRPLPTLQHAACAGRPGRPFGVYPQPRGPRLRSRASLNVGRRSGEPRAVVEGASSHSCRHLSKPLDFQRGTGASAVMLLPAAPRTDGVSARSNCRSNLRRIIMSNLQGNGPTTEYKNRLLPTGRPSGSWIIGAIVVFILIVGAGFIYETRSTDLPVEHRAAVTDQPSPAASPMTPTVAPTVLATPQASSKP